MTEGKHWAQAAPDAIARAEEAAEGISDAVGQAQAWAAIAIAQQLAGVVDYLRDIKGEVATLAAHSEAILGHIETIAVNS